MRDEDSMDPETIDAVYVDDLIIFSLTEENLRKANEMLSKRFEMKDVRPIECCLDLVIKQNGTSLSIHQQPYIKYIQNIA